MLLVFYVGLVFWLQVLRTCPERCKCRFIQSVSMSIVDGASPGLTSIPKGIPNTMTYLSLDDKIRQIHHFDFISLSKLKRKLKRKLKGITKLEYLQMSKKNV